MSPLKDLAKKQELIELKVQEQEKTFERIIMNMESRICAHLQRMIEPISVAKVQVDRSCFPILYMMVK